MRTREKKFLIDLAMDQWESQGGKKLNRSLLDVQDIRNNVDFEYGFHILGMTESEFIEFRIYFNLADTTKLGNFRIELDGVSFLNRLDDEKYVAVGTVSAQTVFNEQFVFKDLGVDWGAWSILLNEDGEPLLDEDGNFLYLEDAVSITDLATIS